MVRSVHLNFAVPQSAEALPLCRKTAPLPSLPCPPRGGEDRHIDTTVPPPIPPPQKPTAITPRTTSSLTLLFPQHVYPPSTSIPCHATSAAALSAPLSHSTIRCLLFTPSPISPHCTILLHLLSLLLLCPPFLSPPLFPSLLLFFFVSSLEWLGLSRHRVHFHPLR